VRWRRGRALRTNPALGLAVVGFISSMALVGDNRVLAVCCPMACTARAARLAGSHGAQRTAALLSCLS
jgi:hypothetical protein